jgi:RimJ/RimL family protein N-acetyltransferase
MEPLTLHPVTASNQAAVVALTLSDAQLAFVSPVATMLAVTRPHPDIYPYEIRAGARTVGFFLLNFGAASTAPYRAPQGVGLEGFVIDLAEQGKGYGPAALGALSALLRDAHPEVREVDLTVNCANTAAIRAYLKAGFEDTGRLYEGGRSGPQHIFRLPLHHP